MRRATATRLRKTRNPHEPEPSVKLTHPAWSKYATIYQLSTRQFSEEGTFRAAQRELPRIKALGADIVWLMPIHPIGEENRFTAEPQFVSFSDSPYAGGYTGYFSGDALDIDAETELDLDPWGYRASRA